MTFGGSGGGSSSIAGSSDVALSNPANNEVLAYDSGVQKWKNAASAGAGGGVPSTYALGRVRYNSGWPVTRPSGYAYIDWIKSGPSDPDPASGLMVAGDTITDWS